MRVKYTNLLLFCTLFFIAYSFSCNNNEKSIILTSNMFPLYSLDYSGKLILIGENQIELFESSTGEKLNTYEDLGINTDHSPFIVNGILKYLDEDNSIVSINILENTIEKEFHLNKIRLIKKDYILDNIYKLSNEGIYIDGAKIYLEKNYEYSQIYNLIAYNGILCVFVSTNNIQMIDVFYNNKLIYTNVMNDDFYFLPEFIKPSLTCLTENGIGLFSGDKILIIKMDSSINLYSIKEGYKPYYINYKWGFVAKKSDEYVLMDLFQKTIINLNNYKYLEDGNIIGIQNKAIIGFSEDKLYLYDYDSATTIVKYNPKNRFINSCLLMNNNTVIVTESHISGNKSSYGYVNKILHF